MAEKKTSDERVRNWGFIVYPESAPADWRDILDGLHVAWIESPLHEFDVNSTGELKKPHWHVLLMFEGKKSYAQVKKISDSVCAARPEIIHSAKGNVRYMAHLDNPEKYQYSPSDIVSHGGVDVNEYLKPTSAARYDILDEMIEFIDDNGITEYCDLVRYARKYRRDDWFSLLADSVTYFINAYIKSVRNSKSGSKDKEQ